MMLRTVFLIVFLLTTQSVSAQNEVPFYPLQKGFLSIAWGTPKNEAIQQLVKLTQARQVQPAKTDKNLSTDLVTLREGRFRGVLASSITLRFDRLYNAKRDGLSHARIVIRDNSWRRYPGRRRVAVERLLMMIQADHSQLPPPPPMQEMPPENTYSYGHYDGAFQYSVTLDATDPKEIVVTYSAMAQEEMHGF